MILILAAVSLNGCLKRDFVESEINLSVDYAVKHLECDSPLGAGLLADTLRVTANRSWSAAVREGADWLTIDATGYQNFGQVTEVAALPFRASDNSGDVPRTAKLVIYSGGASVSVSIIQDAWSPRLMVTTPFSAFYGIKAAGDEILLDIVSNTSWQLKNDPNDEASLSYNMMSGEYSASVLVTVAPNMDKTAGKTATISISADGCQTIDIPVKQNKGE